MADSLDKRYYKISDVSEMLGLPIPTIRFWESQFSELRPRRSDGGTRRYTPADIERLRVIRFLVKEKGLKIEAAKEHLRKNRHAVEKTHEVIGRLRDIRRKLTDLLNALEGRPSKS